MQDKNYVEFTPPKGWQPPEMEGDEFDQTDTYKVTPDGKVCMVKFGEVEMPQPEDKQKEKAPDYKDYGQSIVSAVGQPQE